MHLNLLDIWGFNMYAREEIKTLLRKEVETLAGAAVNSDDQEIFAEGFLDSLNVLHIIVFMESNFSVSVDPFSISLDTLGSINKVADYIEMKLGE